MKNVKKKKYPDQNSDEIFGQNFYIYFWCIILTKPAFFVK